MGMKENRLYYLSHGRCPSCGGKNPVIPGRVLCFGCQKVHDEGYKARQQRWREEGLCTRCGRERDDPKRKLCERCRAYQSDNKRHNSERSRERRNRLELLGLCIMCGKRAVNAGHKVCEICLTRKRARDNSQGHRQAVNAKRKQMIESGLCIDCGKPLNGLKWRCADCKERNREAAIKYRIIKRIEKQAEEARKCSKRPEF